MNPNKKILCFTPVLFFIMFSAGLVEKCSAGGSGEQDIRPSILAGTWYPADRDTLSGMIESFLSSANSAPSETVPQAILAPHAGYRYSGSVAAHAYSLIRGRDFKTVILVGPSHRVAFRGISVNLQRGYQTPLGSVPINEELGKKLIAASPSIQWVPRAHAGEHSLEIQLPFLQTVLRDFSILPILMGQQDFATSVDLARCLTRILDPSEKTLLLASTDLSHFHGSKEAEALDGIFIKHIEAFDPEKLSLALRSGECEACGGGPAVTIMLAAGALGSDRARILKYAHSGHVTGDLRQVVGYLSAAFLKNP